MVTSYSSVILLLYSLPLVLPTPLLLSASGKLGDTSTGWDCEDLCKSVCHQDKYGADLIRCQLKCRLQLVSEGINCPQHQLPRHPTEQDVLSARTDTYRRVPWTRGVKRRAQMAGHYIKKRAAITGGERAGIRPKRSTILVCLTLCEQCINVYGSKNYNGNFCARACVLSNGNSIDPDCENPAYYSVW